MTSEGWVLDTDVVSLIQRDARHLSRLSHVSLELRRITVVTEIEQLQGRFQQIITASTPEGLLLGQQHLDATRQWLAGMHILPFDTQAATTFGRLLSRLLSLILGKLKRKDLLIASIALSRNYVLVTRNVRDFRRVSGMRIEDWCH